MSNISRSQEQVSNMSAGAAADQPSSVLDLPQTWLSDLFQHVASGPEGLSHAAALTQTCKSFYALSEDPSISYRNLHVTQQIQEPDHPIWHWLAKRKGRVCGLKAKLQLCTPADSDGAAMRMDECTQPLQILSAMTNVQLTVELLDHDYDPTPPYTPWLGQYACLIDHLDADVDINWVTLRALADAFAPCKSLELGMSHSEKGLDMDDLGAVAGSLVWLAVCNEMSEDVQVRGLSTLPCLSRLNTLSMHWEDLSGGDVWGHLSSLSSLRDLSLTVSASADPSALSALTGLTSLYLNPLNEETYGVPPFSFSSLQLLSTLRQLEVLTLGSCVHSSSLQGLGHLSSLKELRLMSARGLMTVQGLSTTVTNLSISYARGIAGIGDFLLLEKLFVRGCDRVTSLKPLACLPKLSELKLHWCPLVSLEGIEGLLSTSLRSLSLSSCPITSLQPLSALGAGLKRLEISSCSNVLAKVLELPNVLPTADVSIWECSIEEVVLADGVRKPIREG